MDADLQDALLGAASQAVEELLKTPQVQHLIAQVEEAAIDSLPGVEGALLRFIRALAPHDEPSAGFRKDGPG